MTKSENYSEMVARREVAKASPVGSIIKCACCSRPIIKTMANRAYCGEDCLHKFDKIRRSIGRAPLVKPEPITTHLDEVIGKAAQATGQSLDDVLRNHRNRSLCYLEVRQLAAWWMVTKMGESLSQAGRTIGKQNHATIINSIKMVEDRIATRHPLWIEFLSRMESICAGTPVPVLTWGDVKSQGEVEIINRVTGAVENGAIRRIGPRSLNVSWSEPVERMATLIRKNMLWRAVGVKFVPLPLADFKGDISAVPKGA